MVKKSYLAKKDKELKLEVIKKLNPNKNLFEIINSEEVSKNIYESEVVLRSGNKSRDLIVEISNYTEIISFKQKIPNMNDIFIMKVKEGGNYE